MMGVAHWNCEMVIRLQTSPGIRRCPDVVRIGLIEGPAPWHAAWQRADELDVRWVFPRQLALRQPAAAAGFRQHHGEIAVPLANPVFAAHCDDSGARPQCGASCRGLDGTFDRARLGSTEPRSQAKDRVCARPSGRRDSRSVGADRPAWRRTTRSANQRRGAPTVK